MKTKFLLLSTMLVLSFTANATKWRVNNNSGVDADFTTAQEAVDGAEAGDTLYFEGSSSHYGNLTTTKKLTIIGPGYFLSDSENTICKDNILPAELGKVEFSVETSSNLQGVEVISKSSAGSVMKGMTTDYITTFAASGIILVGNNANNINFVSKVINHNNSSSGRNVVKRNLVKGSVSFRNGTNQIIQNNIIGGLVQGFSKGSAIITNNVVNGSNGIRVYNSIIENNICVGVIKMNTGIVKNNNLESLANFSAVYVNTGTDDAKYQLSDSSPAKGAGVYGKDLGAFGGVDPYVLSGMQTVPYLYNANIATQGSQATGLKVELTFKGHE